MTAPMTQATYVNGQGSQYYARLYTSASQVGCWLAALIL